MTMEELTAMGLPKLPPGYFYRVSTDPFGELRLQIRISYRFFGSKLHAEEYTYPGNHPDKTLPELFRMLGKSIEGTKAFADIKKNRWNEIRKYEGDHK